MNYSLLLFLLLFTFRLDAQIHYLPEDTVIFNRFLQYSKQGEQSLIHTAHFFINTPYIGGTLEGDEVERLRINMRELDCVTFVENVIALQLMLQSEKQTFDNFCEILQKIRYRNGVINGYPSRLHYFSEWLYNNRQKGIVSLPATTNCKNFEPELSYMSTHCDAYPALKNNPKLCNEIAEIEKNINNLINFCFIEKDKIKDSSEEIHNGDIIAITTHIKGLDIVHTGFALQQNGKIYLLHASSSSDAKKVIISNEPLHDYLARYENHSGVIIGRLTIYD